MCAYIYIYYILYLCIYFEMGDFKYIILYILYLYNILNLFLYNILYIYIIYILKISHFKTKTYEIYNPIYNGIILAD